MIKVDTHTLDYFSGYGGNSGFYLAFKDLEVLNSCYDYLFKERKEEV